MAVEIDLANPFTVATIAIGGVTLFIIVGLFMFLRANPERSRGDLESGSFVSCKDAKVSFVGERSVDAVGGSVGPM